MRTYSLFAAVAFVLVSYSVASAGIVTSALSQPPNNTNDYLSDDSLGFIIDQNKPSDNPSTPGVGDVAWGIAQISMINNTGTANEVYLVYSATLASVVSDPTTGKTTWSHTPTSGTYSLGSLLGTGLGLPSTAIAAVIEYTGPADTTHNPFTGTNYPFGSSNFSSQSPSAVKTDLGKLMANASVVFTVGLTAPPPVGGQYFNLTLYENTWGKVTAGMAVDYVATGLNEADFKPLFGFSPFTSAVTDVTQTLQSATYNKTYVDPNTGGTVSYISTRDDGNYLVNYVPEPASMIGLASLALAGAGLGFARRRKA